MPGNRGTARRLVERDEISVRIRPLRRWLGIDPPEGTGRLGGVGAHPPRLLPGALALGFSLLAGGLGWLLLTNAVVYLGAVGKVKHTVEQVPECEVAIVLGAGPGSPTLDARLDAGHALWRAGRVRRLLITGGTDGTGYGETEYMWRYLRRAGVPAEALVVDPFGLRTLDSVWRARRVFGFKRVVVVTQEFHLHRGVLLARWSGLEAVGFAAEPGTSPEYRFSVRREWLARPAAVIDILIGREPRYGDQPPNLANHPAR
jgi:SanA protein